MTNATLNATTSGFTSWFGSFERWMDERGKGAWIAAMILGFIFFWPIGLALLAYMIWSKGMFDKKRKKYGNIRAAMKSSGNAAFDAYKADTLRRLEEEQDSFETFLQRLRDAKDKAEFDQFMAERARKAREADIDPDAVRA